MESLGAPPLPPVSLAQTGAPVVVVATVAEPSQALLNLTQGARFDVKVVGDVLQSMATVDSDFGGFSMKLPLVVPEGTTLTLQVGQAGPSMLQMRVIGMNGQPLAQFLGGMPGKGDGGGMPGLPPGPAMAGGQQAGAPWGGAVDVLTGRTLLGGAGAAGAVAPPGAMGTTQAGIPAVVVSGASGGTSAATVDQAAFQAGGRLATGSQLVVRIASIQVPTGGEGAPANVTAQPGQPDSLASPAPAAAPRAPASGGFAAYAAAQGMGARDVPILPPGTPPTTLPPGAMATGEPLMTLTGTAVGSGAVGAKPVVHTAAGTVVLDTRLDLPAGATVTLEVMSHGAPPALAAGGLAARLDGQPPVPGQPWPTLNEALAVLQHTDPAAAQQLANMIPALGPRLAITMMGFIGSVRGSGEARGWPGDSTLKSLEKAGPRGAALAKKLGEELAAGGSTRAADPSTGGGDWRMINLPFMNNGQVETITLSVHRPPEEAEEEGRKGRGGGDPGVRFLLDLDLSKLGRVQLDGLARRSERRFDLMFRTSEPLPQDIRRDIATLFKASGVAMDMGGNLVFQVVKDFVKPGSAATARGGYLFGMVV